MAKKTTFEITDGGEVQIDLKSFFASLGQEYDNIVIGDTGHAKSELIDFFQSDIFLGGLKEGGVSVVGRELEEKLSYIADIFNNAPTEVFEDEAQKNTIFHQVEAISGDERFSYRQHSMSSSIRANDMEVAYIDADRHRNMADHMISEGVSSERAEEATTIGLNMYYQLGNLLKAAKSDSPMQNMWQVLWHEEEFGQALWDVVTNPIASFTMAWHAKGAIEQRIEESNVEIADNIKAAKKSGEPIAVIMGDGHMRYSNGQDDNVDGKIDVTEADLDELMGENTVYVRVEVGTHEEFQTKDRKNQEDQPDYYVFLGDNDGNGKIVRTTSYNQQQQAEQKELCAVGAEHDASMDDIGQLNSQTLPITEECALHIGK